MSEFHRLSCNSVAATAPIALNHKASGFNVTLGVVCGTGDGQWGLQYTIDDIQNAAITPTWVNHATITGKTGTFIGNLTFPVSAVRVNVTVVDSSSAVFTILEGSGNG